MKSLQHILEQHISTPSIDGHVHICSHRGLISNELSDQLVPIRIAFADIEYDHPTEYSNMVSIYKDTQQLSNTYLLATGTDGSSVESIYKDLVANDMCVGFGELKLYDEYNGIPVNFKKISFAHDVCDLSEEVGDLPVYVHYELNNIREVRLFENLLKAHPSVPIVLCHCGMNDNNIEYAWGQCVRLSHIYNNMWLDVSWTAAKWLSYNPLIITQAPSDRIFWGSDVSPRLEQHGFKTMTMNDINTYRDTISLYINSDTNLRALFNI